MAHFFADEHFYAEVVEELRKLGHDVVTVQERGIRGLDDTLVLELAVQETRAVLTNNRWDFIRLHNHNPDHAGIVVCTADRNYSSLARRIHDAVIAIPDLKRQLIRIYRPS